MSGQLLRSFFEPLILKASDAITRFPLSVAIGCILYAGCASGLFKSNNEIVYQLIVAFFWSVTARLVSDSHNFSRQKYILIALAGFLVFGSWIHYCHAIKNNYSEMIAGVFVFATMFVLPFANRRKTDGDFWNFNYTFWTLLVFGLLLSVIFYLSGAAILQMIKVMTGFRNMPFEGLFMLTAFIFGPVFVLSNLPKDLTAPPQSEKILVAQCNIQAYLIIPLFLIYSVIFYIYSGSMIVKGELPKGELAYYVMGFGIVGMISYFSNFGFASAKPVLGFFRKHYFYLLSLPLILLALAVYQRIDAYGITEDRYSLVMLWLFFVISLIVHFSRFRVSELRIIPSILLVILFIASVGPFSATNVSNRSQMTRLEALVAKHDLAPNGKFARTEKEIPFEDRKNLSSLLDYFTVPGKKELLANRTDKLSSHEILKDMNIDYVSRYEQRQNADNGETISFNRQRKSQDAIKTSGYDYITENLAFFETKSTTGQKVTLEQGDKIIDLELLSDGKNITVKRPGFENIVFDITKIATPKPNPDKPLLIKSQSDWADMGLFIESFRGNMDAKKNFTVENIYGRFLIKLKK